MFLLQEMNRADHGAVSRLGQSEPNAVASASSHVSLASPDPIRKNRAVRGKCRRFQTELRWSKAKPHFLVVDLDAFLSD